MWHCVYDECMCVPMRLLSMMPLFHATQGFSILFLFCSLAPPFALLLPLLLSSSFFSLVLLSVCYRLSQCNKFNCSTKSYFYYSTLAYNQCVIYLTSNFSSFRVKRIKNDTPKLPSEKLNQSSKIKFYLLLHTSAINPSMSCENSRFKNNNGSNSSWTKYWISLNVESSKMAPNLLCKVGDGVFLVTFCWTAQINIKCIRQIISIDFFRHICIWLNLVEAALNQK